MPAPQTALLDDFNRADENPLSDGGNWAAGLGGASQCQVVSNQAAAQLATTSESLWSPLTLFNQEAYATIAASAGDIIDDFNRADENPIAHGWTNVVANLKVVSDQCAGTVSTTSQAHFTNLTAALTDCIVYATIATLPGAGNIAGVMARGGAASSDGYLASYNQGTGVQLFKVVGGTPTQLGATVAVTLAAGDKIKIVCAGTTIQAWYFHSGAWTLAVSVTDSTYASGYPGLRLRGTTVRVDDFGGIENGQGPIIRAETSGTDTKGYTAYARPSGIDLIRFDSSTVSVTLGTYAATIGVGDQIAVQAVGSAISVWYKPFGGAWSQVISVTDSTYGSGKIGIRIRGTAAALDDFGGGIPAGEIDLPSIPSNTHVYAPSLVGTEVLPFIGSVTAVYPPTLSTPATEVDVPFIASKTRLYELFALFDPNRTYSGPGNGGEIFPLRLAPNGVTETATLAADITDTDTALTLTGDGSLPSDAAFMVTIDDEVLYVVQVAPGSYRIRGRAMSNTTAAAHAAGATVSWGDSYDLAIRAGADIAHSFTADINDTGSFTYDGWLICFDSSQGYLAGDRYPMHVTEVLGVFDAGAGSIGANRCDGPQPNAIATPTGVSDACPAALSNPARITTDIVAGDVALVRYTNPEAVVLDLGSRSAALQSWFGLKRVDATDVDDLADPDGYVVDTIPSGAGPGPFTGSINHEWPNPVPLETGIAPDASDAAGTPVDTPNPVPWTTVTLPGTDRYFTYGPPHYSEKGWPMCCLAVRQGDRRVPRWQSWDWHDYAYVYSGFGIDDTFCQLLINRNGISFDSVPAVDLPGPQDIDGPDAVWDDGTYDIAASWYVVLFGTPYIVFGPAVGGDVPPSAGTSGGAPGVVFVGGSVDVTIPPTVEGGSGGDINPPAVSPSLFQAASV